jgi:hypothetical protein
VVTPERFTLLIITLSSFVFTAAMFWFSVSNFHQGYHVPKHLPKRYKDEHFRHATFYGCFFVIMLPVTYTFYYSFVN